MPISTPGCQKDLKAEEKKKHRSEIRRQAMEEFLKACDLAPGAEEFKEIGAQLQYYASELRDAADDLLESLKAAEAFTLAEKAARFGARDPENHALRARVLSRLGKFDEAAEAYGDALRLDAQHLRSLFDYARLEYDRFRHQESVQLLDRFLKATQESSKNNAALRDLRISAQALKNRALKRMEQKTKK